MIRFIRCCSATYVTARKLADEISIEQEGRCFYYNKLKPCSPGKRHVRWGSLDPTSDNGINLLAAVMLASIKLKALVKMKHSGISVPTIFQKDQFEVASPVHRIFRRNKRQNADDDPLLVNANESANLTCANKYDYALERIESDEEYRVHVFGGMAIILLKKILRPGYRNPHPYIRSHSKGWDTEGLQGPPLDGLIELAVAAVNCLGLHFGAVDIVRSRIDNRVYVLEVNTGPALDQDGARLYARKFVEWDRATPGG